MADHVVVGKIICMERSDDIAYGIACSNGVVIDLLRDSNGVDAFLAQHASGHSTTTRHLKHGQVVIPGFVDAHSHVLATGRHHRACVLSRCKDHAELLSRLVEHEKKLPPDGDDWLVGVGYDDTGMKEMAHPTKQMLDQLFFPRRRRVLLHHVSGHVGVANSAALLVLSNISHDAKLVNVPSGLLKEQALFSLAQHTQHHVATRASHTSGLQLYSRHGITTACEAWFTANDCDILEKMTEERFGFPDLVVFPICMSVKHIDSVARLARRVVASCGGGVHCVGVKLVLDGSIQARTAYLTKPYYTESNQQHEDGGDVECCGVQSHSQSDCNEMVRRFLLEHHLDLQIHCNGDAAIQMALDAVHQCMQIDANATLLRRVTLVHCQTARPDQLDQMRRLQMVHPSFFVSHTFFWGDRHFALFLGPERAEAINPVRSAMRQFGLHVSNHHDSPVTDPNMMRIVWCAVNRQTSSRQRILGPHEQVDVWEGLATVTREAAWQLRLHDRKGTLSRGKDADMVVLSHDPLTMPQEDLASIEVLETWAKGKIIYTKSKI